MGNEGARKLALSTLRFEQYTPLDSSLPLRMTPFFQLPTAYYLPPTAHAPKRSDPKGATPRPHTPLDSSLSLRMTPPFLLSTVHLPTKILTTNHQPLATLLYFSHGIHRNGA